ncbi:phage holin family protein [Tenacibaculum maritimum]|uniref:phage holin family protein n=1 Tax=Tenacibaculum maritimum TaxID=107401 RepID=UPI0038778D49
MKLFLKILLTALVVVVLAKILLGIEVYDYVTALWVAVTISLLNIFVKPLLVIFTLPVTILTLGLFLFVINAIIIILAGRLITGFVVNGFLIALLFSILLSIFRSFLFLFLKEDKK